MRRFRPRPSRPEFLRLFVSGLTPGETRDNGTSLNEYSLNFFTGYLQNNSQSKSSKNIQRNLFHYPRVSPGDQPLTKSLIMKTPGSRLGDGRLGKGEGESRLCPIAPTNSQVQGKYCPEMAILITGNSDS